MGFATSPGMAWLSVSIHNETDYEPARGNGLLFTCSPGRRARGLAQRVQRRCWLYWPQSQADSRPLCGPLSSQSWHLTQLSRGHSLGLEGEDRAWAGLAQLPARGLQREALGLGM